MNKIKNSLAIILTLLALSASAHGSIQDTFFGCKLGVSTKNDVIRELNRRGFSYDNETNNIIIVTDVLFGNSVWDYCAFNFNSNNVLYIFALFYSAEPDEAGVFRDNVINSLTKRYGESPDGYDKKDETGFSFYWGDQYSLLWCKFEYARYIGDKDSITLFYSNHEASDNDSDY